MNARVPIDTDSQGMPSLPGGAMPGPHASTHKHGGADEVATAVPGANQIVKAMQDGKISDEWISSAIARLTDLTGESFENTDEYQVRKTDGYLEFFIGGKWFRHAPVIENGVPEWQWTEVAA